MELRGSLSQREHPWRFLANDNEEIVANSQNIKTRSAFHENIVKYTPNGKENQNYHQSGQKGSSWKSSDLDDADKLEDLDKLDK